MRLALGYQPPPAAAGANGLELQLQPTPPQRYQQQQQQPPPSRTSPQPPRSDTKELLRLLRSRSREGRRSPQPQPQPQSLPSELGSVVRERGLEDLLVPLEDPNPAAAGSPRAGRLTEAAWVEGAMRLVEDQSPAKPSAVVESPAFFVPRLQLP